MPFTPRLLLALLVAPLFVALSWFWQPFNIFALAYLAVISACYLKDYRGLPKKSDIEVARTVPSDMSIARDNHVALNIRYRGRHYVLGEFRDGIPPLLMPSTDTVASNLAPSTKIDLAYTLRPMRRGGYSIGPVHARFTGAWGLAERKMQFAIEGNVQVIPDIAAARAYDIRLKRGLVRRAGNRLTRIAGRGSEFESLRQYVPDDDPRHIDWRSSARHGKLLTRNYQPESKQRIIIAIDLGRMMLGKYGDVAKIDSVLNACLLLTHAAITAGDSVGFIAVSDELEVRVPTRSGKGQVNMILRQSASLDPRPIETDFRILSRELGSLERRRALVVIFSDFIDETLIDELLQTLTTIKHRHRVIVAAVRDAETYELADAIPTTEREAFGAAAAAHLLVQRQTAIKRLKAAGILVADLDQRDLSLGVVERYLELRETAVF